MRQAFLATIIALLPLAAPMPAAAQAARQRSGEQSITREQYVQRASEAAGRRFDAMDTGHRGVLTRAEMRAWREQRRAAHAGTAARPPAAQ